MSNLEKLKEVFSQYTDAEITEESAFEDLDMDSLTVVEATMEMEDKYNIQFLVGEEIQTVGDLLAQMPAEEGDCDDKN